MDAPGAKAAAGAIRRKAVASFMVSGECSENAKRVVASCQTVKLDIVWEGGNPFGVVFRQKRYRWRR
jgi:hypothetical protein